MFRYILAVILIGALTACETEEASDIIDSEEPQAEEQTIVADTPVDQSEIETVTDEELEQFVRVMLRAEEQRIGTRGELRALLEAEDLKMWRFEEIEAASQRDPELRQRRAELKREARAAL
ncbi:hypothetical protein QLX67_05880 [Balneolaceae bacterium ANBcel3]|nr:hypothetical protein [Balneolaceae bacterium ANBcel3]